MVTLLYLLPLWGAFTTSLKTDEEIDLTSPIAWPQRPTASGYIGAFNHLKRALLNSVLITVGGTFGSVGLGAICGYVLALHSFPGANLVFLLLAAGIFLPFQAILIPLFQTVRALRLYDTIGGIVLAHTAYGIPMCAVMFKTFYSEVPKALVRQALTDGSSPWRFYWRVVLPSTKLATVTILIFQFTSIWNELLFGLVLGGPRSMPATVALNNLVGTLAAQWNIQMAGSLLLAVPVLIVYAFLGRYLVRGYMAGAVTAV
ncbi:MAG: carbohydrate ABC transporter permease [Candidatus Bipolaricaulota bacterium]|nr:carbohydrate ABC transporter permease [Candidatus Bipolaricaulota bacterium]MDW8151702.1 carbohydrate ABC transporter permease [Candidatus Bipolaricaulota bacterium]